MGAQAPMAPMLPTPLHLLNSVFQIPLYHLEALQLYSKLIMTIILFSFLCFRIKVFS